MRAADSEEQIFQDVDMKLIVAVCITSERAALGTRALKTGKEYFVAEAPLVGVYWSEK